MIRSAIVFFEDFRRSIKISFEKIGRNSANSSTIQDCFDLQILRYMDNRNHHRSFAWPNQPRYYVKDNALGLERDETGVNR